MQILTTFDTLFDQVLSERLYEKLILQLNKDFLLANIDHEIDVQLSPKELKSQLHETVFSLIIEKFSDYLNLLYIIDVPEKTIKQLDRSDVNKLSEQVTFLILLREWKKVWYRNKN